MSIDVLHRTRILRWCATKWVQQASKSAFYLTAVSVYIHSLSSSQYLVEHRLCYIESKYWLSCRAMAIGKLGTGLLQKDWLVFVSI